MPSRRKLIEMSEADMREYISNAQTLIIISNGRNGFPHPMPMWFCVDEDGSLLCTTFGKSQKVLNWRRDAKASLLIESGTTYDQLRGVVIYAQTEILDSSEQVIDTLVKINSKGQSLTEEQRTQLRESVAKTATKRIALRFIPERFITWDHTKLGGRY